MDIRSRIVKVIEGKNLTVTEVERLLGWSKSSLLKAKEIRSDRIGEFLHFFQDVSAEWLLLGEGEMLRSKEEAPIMNFEKGKPYYNVDFICGFDLVENDQTTNPDCLIWFPMYNNADCWCNATGMSMYPDICPGDIIALKEVKDFRSFIPSGEIYGIVTKEHRTIKKVCKSEIEGCIKLIPTNQSKEFTEQDIPLDIVVRVYKVLGSLRRF